MGISFSVSSGNGASSPSSRWDRGGPLLPGCLSSSSPLLAAAAGGVSCGGRGGGLFPDREISGFIKLRKRREANEGGGGERRRRGVPCAGQGADGVGFFAIHISRHKPGSPRGSPLVSRGLPRERWTRRQSRCSDACGLCLHSCGGRGVRLGTRQSLPGANARHKSSISLRSDSQSCRDRIIKRN